MKTKQELKNRLNELFEQLAYYEANAPQMRGIISDIIAEMIDISRTIANRGGK